MIAKNAEKSQKDIFVETVEDVMRTLVTEGLIRKHWKLGLITMNSVIGRRILEIIQRA